MDSVFEMLEQRILDARLAAATDAIYPYECQEDPEAGVGGFDAQLDRAAADRISKLEAELERARKLLEACKQEEISNAMHARIDTLLAEDSK